MWRSLPSYFIYLSHLTQLTGALARLLYCRKNTTNVMLRYFGRTENEIRHLLPYFEQQNYQILLQKHAENKRVQQKTGTEETKLNLSF